MKEKVPEFRSPLKIIIIITIGLLIFLGIMIFFWWFDRLLWYGIFISQSIISLIASGFIYCFTTLADKYKKKYGELAYRYFFFHIVIFMLITGNAGIFHVLIVEGSLLLPLWFAIIFGMFFIFMRFLFEWHLRNSGFNEVGHGLGIYMLFPEEGTRIKSEIYSFIRHPMYAGDLCLAIGFAFLKNNLFAFLIALIAFIPYVVAIKCEDKELIKRFGEKHKQYIKETGAIIPHLKKLGKFLKYLFSKEKKTNEELN
ncbi:MAG: isoprenylcysteine carboxylmethyltransferase family protein [Candidatus Lokiarchaeota archaeon]|nr:isoprenylcysteine carboxylmethyltransferase family protein [Candidatus Lokiarchaeota archaeon]